MNARNAPKNHTLRQFSNYFSLALRLFSSLNHSPSPLITSYSSMRSPYTLLLPCFLRAASVQLQSFFIPLQLPHNPPQSVHLRLHFHPSFTSASLPSTPLPSSLSSFSIFWFFQCFASTFLLSHPLRSILTFSHQFFPSLLTRLIQFLHSFPPIPSFFNIINIVHIYLRRFSAEYSYALTFSLLRVGTHTENIFLKKLHSLLVGMTRKKGLP